jgi:hypothetical protein
MKISKEPTLDLPSIQGHAIILNVALERDSGD